MSVDLKSLTEKVLALLKDRGADMAYCTASQSETREFNVDGGEFSLFRTLFDNSLSLTAFKDGKKGSVGINRFDDASLEKAADDCMTAVMSSSPDDAWALAPCAGERRFQTGELCPELDRLFDRTKELMDTVTEDFPKIVIEQMIVSHSKSHSVYRNTNGACYIKDSGSYNAELMFSGHDGEAASSFFSSGVGCVDLEKPFIELGSIRQDLADVEKQIHPSPADGKFTGVMVLTPASFASFMEDIIENFAAGTPVLEGTSIWRDKLDSQVADERLTVSFCPSDTTMVASQSYTNEGFVTDDFDLIRNGVLKKFVIDLYVANKTGLDRSENGGSNMIIAPGTKSIEEIISSIDRGIIVGRFSGGEPASSGDFSGVAKNSFLIENGKIAGALSETMISGNLNEMLMHLVELSTERQSDGYTVLPYAAFDGITVSGK